MIGNGSGLMRNRRGIVVGIFLAALVLVPVLEGVHDHGDLGRGTACVVCVVADHATASNAPILRIDAPGAALLDSAHALRAPGAEPPASASTSRAPPPTRAAIGA